MKKYLYIALIMNIFNPFKAATADVAYIHIFDSVTALPNECYLDAGYPEHGISFMCKSGRVTIGNVSELKNEFFNYVKETIKSETKHCGLNITKFGQSGLDSHLVRKDKQYMLFATKDEGVFKLAMSVYCSNSKL